MRDHRRSYWSRFLIGVAMVAFVFGAIRGCFLLVEIGIRRVYPSENHLAEHIRAIGGTYRVDRLNQRHIVVVSLRDTLAADDDIEKVLQLEYLEHLDLTNSCVTDAALDHIIAHKNLKTLRVAGSAISPDALHAALAKSGERVYVED